MAKSKLIDVRLYWGGFDLSGPSNTLEIGAEVEEKDSTGFEDTARRREGALQNGSLTFGGLKDDAFDDAAIFAGIGQSHLASVIPPKAGGGNPAVGDLGLMLRGLLPSMPAGGTLGDLEPYTLAGSGDGPYIAGSVGMWGVKASSESGAGLNLGAVAANKQIWVGWQVLALAGTSVDGVLESDATDTWGGGETARVNMTQVLAAGFNGADELKSSAQGTAITDPWWRFRLTLVGSSATVAVVIGIY